MRTLVAQPVYYNLNRWQLHNEAAHTPESAKDYRKTRESYQSTFTSLYQAHYTTADLPALYKQPLADLLTMSNERLTFWLQSHLASTSYYRAQRTPALHPDPLHHELQQTIQHEIER